MFSEMLSAQISKMAHKHREGKREGGDLKKVSKKKHPGFKGAEKSVESEGYSKKIAGAIIASSSRNASKGAKRK